MHDVDANGVDVKYDQEYVIANEAVWERLQMIAFCYRSLAPERIAFSEKRVRCASEASDPKKISAGDSIEVDLVYELMHWKYSSLFVFRCSRERKMESHMAGGQPL